MVDLLDNPIQVIDLSTPHHTNVTVRATPEAFWIDWLVVPGSSSSGDGIQSWRKDVSGDWRWFRRRGLTRGGSPFLLILICLSLFLCVLFHDLHPFLLMYYRKRWWCFIRTKKKKEIVWHKSLNYDVQWSLWFLTHMWRGLLFIIKR